MKKSIYIFLITIALPIFSYSQIQKIQLNKKPEYMKFNVDYGLLNGGKLEIMVDTGVVNIDNHICHKINMKGYTAGMVGWFSTIDNEWFSLIDTTTGLPYKFNRKIIENTYKKTESTTFDRAKNMVYVTVKTDTSSYEVKDYPIDNQSHDIISAYFAFRFYDFEDIRKKDTLTIPFFLDDKLYQFKMRYVGKKKIKTIFGKKKALVISPILPPNKMFSSGESIKVYFSDDKYRIPLKMQASLVIGSITAILDEYK